MAKLIPMRGGEGIYAIVDDSDFERLVRYCWRLNKGGYAIRSRQRTDRQLSMFMHREVLGLLSGNGHIKVDHRNRNTLDNRRANLRTCTTAENTRNNRPLAGSSSKYKGVTWHKGCRKWQVSICLDGRRMYLGIFADEAEAALAYDEAAKRLFGEFAYLNFPMGLDSEAS